MCKTRFGWNDKELIIAALVRRLGNEVKLVSTELEPRGGMTIDTTPSGDVTITVNDDDQGKDFPRYVALHGHSCIRLDSVDGNVATYYRDAGHWWADARFVGGKLKFTDAYSIDYPVPHKFIYDGEEITKERWREDNEGYI